MTSRAVDAGAGGLRERVEAWLRAALADHDGHVVELRRLGGGSSRENWAFDWHGGDGTVQPLLLRRDPVASVAETDREQEVALLRALQPAPLPTPIVLADDLSGAWLERPAVVLVRADGRADRSVLRDTDPFRLGDIGRHALAAEVCDLLAAVHSVDPGSGPGSVAGAVGPAAADPAAHEIERWGAEIARTAVEPQPELVWVATWLHEHRPTPPSRPLLVHGDFRPANVLVHHGRANVVLDWEFAHLGDPAEDLGWYCAPMYRREHFPGPDWTREAFLARYGERTGVSVEPERLHFWQVLAMFKLAAIMLAGVHSFLAGDTDRAAGPTPDMLRAVVNATRPVRAGKA